MRNFVIAALSAGLLAAAVPAASAMPMSSAGASSDASISLVAQGCGPGFFRGPYGGCRPMRGFGGPRFGRPGFYGRPGFRRGPGFGRGPGYGRY